MFPNSEYKEVIALLEEVSKTSTSPEIQPKIKEAITQLSRYVLPHHYCLEIPYVLEHLQMDEEEYGDDEPRVYSNVKLTENDIEEIATRLWDHHWLNEQLYEVIKEVTTEYIDDEILGGDDNGNR